MLRSVSGLEEVLGEGYDAFPKSWRSQSAVIRELEMIGGAAGAVSVGVRTRHQEIRWRGMREFGSFAKHKFGRIDPAPVWKAVGETPALRNVLSEARADLVT